MTTSASDSREAALPHWRRNQAAVTIATFIGFTGFTIVMPFLPLYFEQLGIHDTAKLAIWSGLSLGVTPAITAALAPFWARVAERYGRKLLVVRSLAGFVVVMAALATVRSAWQVFALRAALGFFAGYGPIVMTMAADSTPPEQMATAIGWVQTAQRLGPALGPVIGGVLAASVGLRETFVAAAALYAVACGLVLFGYREAARRPDATQDAASRPRKWASVRLVPHFLLFFCTIFALQLVDRSFGPVLPLYLGEIGTEAGRVPFLSGVLFTISAGAAAVGNQITGWILDRAKMSHVVPVAATVSGLCAVIFGLGPSTRVLLIAAVFFGLGMGIATTAIYTGAGRAASAALRGVVFAYLTTAYLVALAVSPVVAGFIGARSMRAVFFVDAAGLAVIAGIVRRQAR